MRRYFSATEYKLSPFSLFLPSSRGKLARTLPMSRFLLPFYQLHAQRAPRNLFPSRGERYVGKKRKGNLPNRGILDQRLVPEGNHIFREKTTASSFFSYLPWAVATAASALPSPVSHFEREIFENVQTCFSGGFLAARPRGSGSDCRRDLTRD